MRLRALFGCLLGGLVLALAFGLSAAAAAESFPELPGMSAAERATGASEMATDAPPAEEAAPEADTQEAAAGSVVTGAAASGDAESPSEVSSSDLEVITGMPGGGTVPVVGEAGAASSTSSPVAPLAALAIAVVVLFTRFLVRLNSVR